MFRPANRSSTLPIPSRGIPAAASRSSNVVPTGSIEKSLRRGVRWYAPGLPVARGRVFPLRSGKGDAVCSRRPKKPRGQAENRPAQAQAESLQIRQPEPPDRPRYVPECVAPCVPIDSLVGTRTDAQPVEHDDGGALQS